MFKLGQHFDRTYYTFWYAALYFQQRKKKEKPNILWLIQNS